MDIFNHTNTFFVEAIVPLRLNKNLTYRIPEFLNDEIAVGKRITIPIGKSKIYTGIIYKISTKPPLLYEAKYIIDVIDDEPIINKDDIHLWEWIANYYLCTLGEVMRQALPAGLKLEGESYLIMNPHYDGEDIDLHDKELIIISHLQQTGRVKIKEVSKLINEKNSWKYVTSLYQKGIVLMQEDIEEMYQKKYQRMICIHPDIQSDLKLADVFNQLEHRSPRQLEIIMFIISNVGIKGWIAKTDILNQINSISALNALIEKEFIIQEKWEVSRLRSYGRKAEKIELTKAQQNAYDSIQEGFRHNKTVLLHGVTSSGKTHIYYQLIDEQISKGNQVLYLLPEISLTTKLVERLQNYFGEHLLVTHSKFSVNERVEIFKEVKKGLPKLIVGTRSSIFLSYKNLGLIIVDEEHDNSFKQGQTKPYFNARDVAIWMGFQRKFNVILGSATPALESYYNAKNGKYSLVTLDKKFNENQKNDWIVVDMTQRKKEKLIFGPFSKDLLSEIEDLKFNKKQGIIFQNRKGYVPFFECNDCGWIPKCISCDISLTYYKFKNHLRCNYCGYTRDVVNQCAACKSTDIQMIGYGTERIEEDLKLFLPEVTIDRLDRESVSTHHKQETIIGKFDKGETDILVGTQLISKGLDFENVDLVAVPFVDLLLSFPDFRATERTFQLILQVAGRTGRRNTKGRVLIQTHRPNHSIFNKLSDEDYLGFYEDEIIDREKFFYPPFSRIIKIEIKHKDPKFLNAAGEYLKIQLEQQLQIKILGPEKPLVSFVRLQYILHLFLKINNNPATLNPLKYKLKKIIFDLEKKSQLKGVRISIDVDPM